MILLFAFIRLATPAWLGRIASRTTCCPILGTAVVPMIIEKSLMHEHVCSSVEWIILGHFVVTGHVAGIQESHQSIPQKASDDLEADEGTGRFRCNPGKGIGKDTSDRHGRISKNGGRCKEVSTSHPRCHGNGNSIALSRSNGPMNHKNQSGRR
ncbi:hypothetical protein IV203_018649 [Nitzschia inconspicua]|uniref:Secreted protein n=1 Tax=Nitzschia inconspicua TaxID=303405 RepID=A0A9K3Q6J6_9STRA|nr:hypothetical protein IV203_018649 [Nitzschia inconspicua]